MSSLSFGNNRRKASRAAGNPANLNIDVVAGQGTSVIAVTDIQVEDGLVAVLEFGALDETGKAIRANHADNENTTISADGQVTIGGGSSIPADHCVAVYWFKFAPST